MPSRSFKEYSTLPIVIFKDFSIMRSTVNTMLPKTMNK